MLAGVDYATFAESYVLVRTTERAILIVAEAAGALPVEMTDRYPEIEWHAIRGMGNILRHEYQNVEPQVLWRVVTKSLPQLAAVVERMFRELQA